MNNRHYTRNESSYRRPQEYEQTKSKEFYNKSYSEDRSYSSRRITYHGDNNLKETDDQDKFHERFGSNARTSNFDNDREYFHKAAASLFDLKGNSYEKPGSSFVSPNTRFEESKFGFQGRNEEFQDSDSRFHSQIKQLPSSSSRFDPQNERDDESRNRFYPQNKSQQEPESYNRVSSLFDLEKRFQEPKDEYYNSQNDFQEKDCIKSDITLQHHSKRFQKPDNEFDTNFDMQDQNIFESRNVRFDSHNRLKETDNRSGFVSDFQEFDSTFHPHNKRFQDPQCRFDSQPKRFPEPSSSFDSVFDLPQKRLQVSDNRFDSHDERFQKSTNRLDSMFDFKNNEKDSHGWPNKERSTTVQYVDKFKSNLDRPWERKKQDEMNIGSFIKQEQTTEYCDEENPGEYDNQGGSDDENSDGGDSNYDGIKHNVFVPDNQLVEKYRFYPPNAYELSKMFNGFVLYFFFKTKNVVEKNPFVSICESFRRSEHFHPLQIEDGFLRSDKFVKFCTLRYQDMMLIRGVGETGNLKEPRVRAAVDLINKFCHYSYTLMMKTDYYSNDAFENILRHKEIPGVFRIVTPEEAPTAQEACQFIDQFFLDDSDCELVFDRYVNAVKWHAKKKGYDTRTPKNKYVTIFKKRSPQYWKKKILASGKMENEKFVLYPPQGPDKNFIENFDIKDAIPQLKKRNLPQTGVPFLEESNLYGPISSNGPDIVKVVMPWEKKGVVRRNRGNAWKLRRDLMEAVKQGAELRSVKKYRFLNKSRKNKLKKQIYSKLHC